MKFKDLKIGTKILIGFGLLCFIAVIIGIVGYVGINRVSKSFDEVSEKRMPSVKYLLEMETAFEAIRVAQRTLLNPNLNTEDKARQFRNMASGREKYTKAMELFATLEQSQEEAKLWKEFLVKLEEWRVSNVKFEALLDKISTIDIFYPMQFLKDLQQFQSDHYALQVQIANAISDGKLFEGGESAATCHLGIWLPTLTTKNPTIVNTFQSINKPHGEFHFAVAQVKDQLRNGNRAEARRIYEAQMLPSAEQVFKYFEIAITEAKNAVQSFEDAEKVNLNDTRVIQNDAMGILREIIAINENISKQAVADGKEAVFASISMVVLAIILGLILAIVLAFVITGLITKGIIKGVEFAMIVSEGDLMIDVDKSYLERKDEIGMLAGALQNMVYRLREIVTGITSGAENIVAASMQMSTTSQQISQGATEQASSSEEITSSIEEMASSIQQNTDNSMEAEKIAVKGVGGIENGSNATNTAVTSMSQIVDKISFVNEIARQTNILALNAAVEAARAGEHGRGFAVVADEVRKLAERSRVAAQEIDQISQNGMKVAENAGNILTELVPEIRRTAQLVQEISAGSNEQNSGANQINNAIQQLNTVTQQNAAASEELATASEELSAQALQLKEMIGYFKLAENKSFGRAKQQENRNVYSNQPRSARPQAIKNSNVTLDYKKQSKTQFSNSVNDAIDSGFEIQM